MTISSALAVCVVYGLGFVSGSVVTIGILMIWAAIPSHKPRKTSGHIPSA